MSQVPEASVVYDTGDFCALYRACRRCKRNALLLLVLFPIIFGVLSYRDGYRGIELFFQALPYLLLALSVVFGIYFVGPWYAVRTRRKYGWAEPMCVRLTDQGISTHHPNQQSLFYWSKIREVAVHGVHIFLFTTPSCAIIIPQRAFNSSADFDAFAAAAQERWEQRHSL
jgi:hypothetical protein